MYTIKMARIKEQVIGSAKKGAKGFKSTMKKPDNANHQQAPAGKRKRRFRHKTKVVRDIRASQRGSDRKPAFRKTIFARAVRVEINKSDYPDCRVTRNAMYLIQQSVEDIVDRLLRHANMMCVGLSKQKTLMTKHVFAVMKVWSDTRRNDLALEYIQSNPDDKEVYEIQRDFLVIPTPPARVSKAV